MIDWGLTGIKCQHCRNGHRLLQLLNKLCPPLRRKMVVSLVANYNSFEQPDEMACMQSKSISLSESRIQFEYK